MSNSKLFLLIFPYSLSAHFLMQLSAAATGGAFEEILPMPQLLQADRESGQSSSMKTPITAPGHLSDEDRTDSSTDDDSQDDGHFSPTDPKKGYRCLPGLEGFKMPQTIDAAAQAIPQKVAQNDNWSFLIECSKVAEEEADSQENDLPFETFGGYLWVDPAKGSHVSVSQRNLLATANPLVNPDTSQDLGCAVIDAQQTNTAPGATEDVSCCARLCAFFSCCKRST